jgi:acetyltransferase-like isoleucine patch superfamily enzyme
MNNEIKIFIKNNKILHSISRRLLRLKNKYRKSITGKKNVIKNKGVCLNVKYDIIGNNNTVEILNGTILADLNIYISGDNHKLKIGEFCNFKGGEFWFEDNNCTISIGNSTTIESSHLAVTEPFSSIFIEDDCMFANYIEVRTGDSHSIIDLSTQKRINKAKNVTIGNHVWVGAHSKILKGVSIGDNSIIGTNSIVTNNIPNNTIAAGIPAKVIKQNIDWLRERI